MHKTILTAAALFAFAGVAQAAELNAYAGRALELKEVRGLIYFTPKGENFEVVTTFDSEGHVFRVVSLLKDGQSTTFSAPGAIGEEASIVEIRRSGDRLLVDDRTRQHHAEVTLPNGRRAD